MAPIILQMRLYTHTRFIFFLAFQLVFTSFSFGANRYWVATTAGLWSNTANWSTTSGGVGGASVPVGVDKAIFNSLGNGNCTIGSAVSVGGIQIISGYSGTINHTSGTLSIGSSNFSIASGSFNTGAYFSCGGTFLISGGTFTSTSNSNFTNSFTLSGGSLNFNSGINSPTLTGSFLQSGGIFNCTSSQFHYLGTSFTKTAGTFNHSAGTFRFANAGLVQINTNITIAFFDLLFNGNSATTNYNLNNDSLFVNGTLSFAGSSQFKMTSGTLIAKGNLTLSNTYNANNSHTASIIIKGSSDQSFTSSVSVGSSRLPDLIIDKSAGNLYFSGNISVEGNWTFINGNVLPQTSTVIFYNTGKSIDAKGISSLMDFYNATLGDANTRTLTGELTVQNVMSLQTGRLLLNANSLVLENSSTGALTVSTGGIISENTSNLSKVVWMIGTTTGAHVIPFENMSVFDIPFTFNLTSGDAGTVTISTYPTANDNTPFPVIPQTVTNVFTDGTLDNSANTVNRFWQIDKTGANPVADLTFTYGDNEWDITEPGNYIGQRYDDITDIWQWPLGSQITNTTFNQVTVPNVTTFSPWTLATASSPLAIEMIAYDVYLSNDKAILDWSTANENDIEKYRIEKSMNLMDVTPVHFENTGKMYYSVTDENTEIGKWYYRIAALKTDGTEEYFDWKMIEKTSDIKFSVCPNPVKSGERVCISGLESATALYPVSMMNLQGKVIFSNQLISNQGNIQFNLPSNISQGCYIIMVSDKNFRLIIE